MNTETKRKELNTFIDELKKEGFSVFVPIKESTYCHFVKDDKIGYVERADFGWNFSTVHMHCRECGTGYNVHYEVYEPKIKMAYDCFVIAPNWASNRDYHAVKKYKNWEDYITHPINQIIEKKQV